MKQIQIISAPGRMVRHHKTMQPISSDEQRPTKVHATAYYFRAILAGDAIKVGPKKTARRPSRAPKE